MSLMQQGLLQAMSNLDAFESDGISARFVFPNEFIGFQGHFKDNPVLPGVCKIQAVVVMYEKFYNKIFRLTSVKQAKYFLPVTCRQEITIQCHSKLNSENSIEVKALVQRNEEKIAMLQLTIQAKP